MQNVKHLYVYFILIKIKYTLTCVFYSNHAHFMDIGHKTHNYMCFIQGVLLPDRQTLRGDSRHEDKHY